MRNSAPAGGSFAGPYHYEMLRDGKRLAPFRKAIMGSVKHGDVVVDVGTGSGILAYIAASKAEKVYAIEKDPVMARYARRNFEGSPYRSKFELIMGDATKVELPEQVDVMTCEMLDTGLITEPQVPVMNHMRQFLKSTGHMIPTKAITYATLVNEKYDFYGASFRSNHYLRHRIPKPRTMSEKQEVFEAVFRKEVPYNVSKTIDFPVIRDGIVNSLQLETRTILWGDIHIEQATTLNPPVVIPLDGDIPVKKGTDLGLNIEYEHNTGFETVVARSIGSPISISTV